MRKAPLFFDISSIQLTDLVENSREILINEGESVEINRNYTDNIYFVFSGSVSVLTDSGKEKSIGVNEFYWNCGTENLSTSELKATHTAFVLEIFPGIIYDQMLNNSEYTKSIISYLSSANE
jgi:hypothetical protein